MPYLESDEKEEERLKRMVTGKTILKIELRGMSSDIALCFTDGTQVVISHLGGLEIEE